MSDGDEYYGTGALEDIGVTDPTDADTDGDGIGDGEEGVEDEDGYVTDPLDADSDDDGLPPGPAEGRRHLGTLLRVVLRGYPIRHGIKVSPPSGSRR